MQRPSFVRQKKLDEGKQDSTLFFSGGNEDGMLVYDSVNFLARRFSFPSRYYTEVLGQRQPQRELIMQMWTS